MKSKKKPTTPIQPCFPGTTVDPFDKMKMELVDVTPTMAAKWLEGNEFNRALSPTRVKEMVADMLAGRWLGLSPEAIVRGEDGSLYDGQHRLHALIQAGMTIRFRVYLNAPRSVLDVLNRGKPRSTSDVIAIADRKRVSHVVSSVMGAIHLLRTAGTLSTARVKMGPDNMRLLLREHENDAKNVFDAIGGSHNCFSNAAFLSALVVAYRAYPKEVTAFARAISTGANLATDSPVLALRDIITKVRQPKMVGSTSGNTTRRDDMNLRTFSALSAFINGESRAFVKPNESARKAFLQPWLQPESG